MKTIPIILFVTAMLSCKSQFYFPQTTISESKEISASDKKPFWILNKPDDANYYVGLGSSNTSISDYQQIAKSKALEDLASEISITISSESILYESELKGQFSQGYQSVIKSYTNEAIEGYELVHNWSGQGEYWICYRLSKPLYWSKVEQKKEIVIQKALQSIKQAIAFQNQLKYALAVQKYLQALSNVEPYMHIALRVNIENTEELLVPFCLNAVQEILADIKIDIDHLTIKKEKSKNVEIPFSCRGVEAIGFKFVSESGIFSSNSSGKIFIKKHNVKQTQLLKIRLAESNFSYLQSQFLKNLIANHLTLPEFSIPVSLAPVVILIQGTEENLGVATKNAITKSILSNSLSNAGFNITTSNDFDLILNFKLNTFKGSSLNGLFVCWADLTVDISDSSENVMHSYRISGVKGINTSYELAGIEAIENIEKVIQKELTEPILKDTY